MQSVDGDLPLATRARSITSQARTSQLLLSFREKEGSHANIDQFFEKEAIMWRMLKATSYWKALKNYLETAAPIPATCFLRMQLQAPQEMSLEELGRVFVEQDSIALMTNVCLVFCGMQPVVSHVSQYCSHTRIPMCMRHAQMQDIVVSRCTRAVLTSCATSSRFMYRFVADICGVCGDDCLAPSVSTIPVGLLHMTSNRYSE